MTAAVPDPRRWWGLVAIGLAQLMVVLDMTVVNIALPSAQADLHISDADRQWVVTAYTLAFGGLLLLGGRLGDVVGRKRLLLVGLIGFAAASALGGLATGPAMLFGARALQGAFAAALAPAALSLLNVTFTDPRERARAFGVYGALAGSGAAVGLILGGVLTQYLDWRWSLLVNTPIAVAAVVLAVLFLHDHRGADAPRLDVPGAVLASAGLATLVYGLSQAEPRGWTDPVVIGAFVATAALLATFVAVEQRAAQPLLPLHLLTDRSRVGALGTVLLLNMGAFGVFLFVTYYLQAVQGYSPLRTGVAFLPMTAAMMIASVAVAARLLPRVGARVLMLPGLALAAAGLAWLTRIQVGSSYAEHVLPGIVMLGLGMGLTFMPAMATATARVAGRDAGVASATLNTSQQVGGSIGVALLNTVATGVTTRYLTAHGAGSPAAIAAGTVHGFGVALWFSVGFVLAALVVAGLLVGRGRTAAAPADKAELAAVAL